LILKFSIFEFRFLMKFRQFRQKAGQQVNFWEFSQYQNVRTIIAYVATCKEMLKAFIEMGIVS
jgi:hypothetical protein